VAWPLVRDLFVRLRETHPAVHLEVAEAPTGQIATWLRDGRHDVGVLNQPGQELLPNVEPLFAPPLLLISRAGDPVTRRTTVPFARLARLRLVTSVMPNGGRVLLEETARQRGIALDVVMDMYSIHLIKKLVREGLAYSISTMTAIREEIAAGQISASRIVAPTLTQPFFLSITATRPPSAAVRIVAQAVREVAAAQRMP
jgi:DNA-binding transcriptional LysR family regulator